MGFSLQSTLIKSKEALIFYVRAVNYMIAVFYHHMSIKKQNVLAQSFVFRKLQVIKLTLSKAGMNLVIYFAARKQGSLMFRLLLDQ